MSFIWDSKVAGNCWGIYNACLGAAVAAITACIAGTAGMEYCRQQYIGCNAEK
jgi:hypothetical protein